MSYLRLNDKSLFFFPSPFFDQKNGVWINGNILQGLLGLWKTFFIFEEARLKEREPWGVGGMLRKIKTPSIT